MAAKNPIENLNKTFDNRIRLGIMSALMVNEEVNFNQLKDADNRWQFSQPY